MKPVEKVATVLGIVLPMAGIVWYSATSYQDMNDRLTVVENRVLELKEDLDISTKENNEHKRNMLTFIGDYKESQATDEVINKRVEKMEDDIDYLMLHHHHDGGAGRAHID